jgi:hypothetical protein
VGLLADDSAERTDLRLLCKPFAQLLRETPIRAPEENAYCEIHPGAPLTFGGCHVCRRGDDKRYSRSNSPAAQPPGWGSVLRHPRYHARLTEAANTATLAAGTVISGHGRPATLCIRCLAAASRTGRWRSASPVRVSDRPAAPLCE